MSIAMTGVQIDESELKENQKPDPFEAAWKEHAGDVDDLHDAAPAKKEKRSLDDLLSEGLDRHYQDEADDEAMPKAIDALDNISAHYPEAKAPEEMLWTFVNLYKDNLKDPLPTSERVRRAFSSMGLRGDIAERMLPNRSRDHLPLDSRTASLDWHVEQAAEKLAAGKTRLSKELRSEIHQIFGPDVPLNVALDTIANWNKVGVKDPNEAARQLAFLVPGVARTEFEFDEWRARAIQQTQQTQITQRAVEQATIDVYNRPDFPKTGNIQVDYANARSVVIDAAQRQMAAAQQQEQEIAGARQQIAAFENDPRNHRFAAVKHVMASFLQSGMADDLQEAYFLAIQPYQQADAVVIGLAFQIAGKLRPQLDRSAAAQLLIGREPKGFLPPRGRHQMDRDR